MNLRCATLSPVAVWVLRQWLGYWRRSAVVSVNVTPGIVTENSVWLAPVGRSR